MTLAPRSWPSSPGLAITTRAGAVLGGRASVLVVSVLMVSLLMRGSAGPGRCAARVRSRARQGGRAPRGGQAAGTVRPSVRGAPVRWAGPAVARPRQEHGHDCGGELVFARGAHRGMFPCFLGGSVSRLVR